MTYSQYTQYGALNYQIANLREIEAFIKAKVPTQLGEREYGYNTELTANIRNDLFRSIQTHIKHIETQMEAL